MFLFVPVVARWNRRDSVELMQARGMEAPNTAPIEFMAEIIVHMNAKMPDQGKEKDLGPVRMSIQSCNQEACEAKSKDSADIDAAIPDIDLSKSWMTF